MPEHGRYEALFKFITILLRMIRLDPDDKRPGRLTPFSYIINSISGEGRHEVPRFPAQEPAFVQVLSCVAALLGFY